MGTRSSKGGGCGCTAQGTQYGGRRRRKGRRTRRRSRTARRKSGYSRKRRRSRTVRRKRRHPKKRQRSRTRKGRLDFVTHRGDKVYNARGRYQRRKRSPYRKRR